MKRQLYDLTDEPFAMFVARVGDILNSENLKHNIVGGVAVQSYLLKMLGEKSGKNIRELLEDPGIRVQDYIRSTDDVDVSLDLSKYSNDIAKLEKILNVLPNFCFEEISPSGESIVKIECARKGASRPQFRVYVNNEGNDDELISMNLSRGNGGDLKHFDQPKYQDFLEGGCNLVLPYCENFAIKIRVPKLEHLLSTKIAASRAKDLMDIHNLIELIRETGRKIEYKEVEQILLSNYHSDNYSRFLKTENLE